MAVPPARPRSTASLPRASWWRRLRWRRVAIIVGALGVVVTLAVVIIGSVLFGQIHRVNIRLTTLPSASASATGNAIASAVATADSSPTSSPTPTGENFLLMGSDSRDFSGGQAYNVAPGSAAFVTGQRSDVVMLVHIPAGTAKATVVSFPRDSWVALPAYVDAKNVTHPAVHAKLNAAFSIGGAPLLVATMEQLTGLHIDHFASVNFPGFQGMVNALGGIDVCVATTRHDTNSGDFLTAGEHHINGVQALALVRDRESFPNQDLARIKDQEYFLSVMLQKVLSAGTLTNPLKLTEFLNVATKSLTVDSGLSLGDMRKLASRFSHLDPTHVNFLTAPIANANYRATSSVYGNQPQDNVELDPAGMATLFAGLANEAASQPRRPFRHRRPTCKSASRTARAEPTSRILRRRSCKAWLPNRRGRRRGCHRRYHDQLRSDRARGGRGTASPRARRNRIADNISRHRADSGRELHSYQRAAPPVASATPATNLSCAP